MNNAKCISSGILMLFCFTLYGQKNGCIPKNVVMRCTLSIQSQKDTIYTLNNIIVEKNTINKLNPEDIISKTILDKQKGYALYGSQGKNGVVIIKTKLSRRKITKIIRETEEGTRAEKIIDTIQ
ncbi:hypothetical protein NAT51_05635 [Flavobacterium amniphilum]|uniref:hypothetical protein n=1 Tax=Flavobacterium amniphilum TaxID=1834035 RepID=UPI00202A009F|nr:hypothetical protein [Flavobacterium amniphilum]MCL9804989.1 hypothetical protein [Flavobacterium amniphilum]